MDTLLSSLVLAADTLNEGLIITDSMLNVLFANRRALDVLKITERELKRKPLIWVSRDFSRGMDAMEHSKPILAHRFQHKNVDVVLSFYPNIDSVTGDSSLCIHLNDLASHQKLKAKEGDSQFYYDALDAIMNTINDWIVIVDRNGIITAMSKSYKEFLQDPSPEGKHVADVIENTRMHHVIESGVPETGEVQLIRGNKMIASRIPIVQNGVVVGAVGKAIFKDIDDFYSLFNRLSSVKKKARDDAESLEQPSTAKYTFDHIIGSSDQTKTATALGRKAARTDSNVLVTGESGTGKEIFAHAIHNDSSRKAKPFVMINCAAIPSELLESELFGYEHGAFTGASRQGKKGKFELADGGTIFLDEIGDMPLAMQAKLLRVLQERELDRIGGKAPVKIDARVIAATNQDIERRVAEGKFRSDLYYRLNVMRINLVPLRERPGEIPEIAEEILRKLTHRMGLIVYGFTDTTLAALKAYAWPGNVRELENVLERALNLLEDDLYIKESILPDYIVRPVDDSERSPNAPAGGKKLSVMTGGIEREMILKTLSEMGGNKKRTAEALGISRAGLYKKLEAYGVSS